VNKGTGVVYAKAEETGIKDFIGTNAATVSTGAYQAADYTKNTAFVAADYTKSTAYAAADYSKSSLTAV
jgi:hypothetical protein